CSRFREALSQGGESQLTDNGSPSANVRLSDRFPDQDDFHDATATTASPLYANPDWHGAFRAERLWGWRLRRRQYGNRLRDSNFGKLGVDQRFRLDGLGRLYGHRRIHGLGRFHRH